MLYSAIFFAALAAAQSTGQSGAVWNANNITLNSAQINALNTNDRLAWCRGEQNTCPVLCGGQTAANSCDQGTLTFNCTCSGGNTPNISDYQQTLPFFVCQEWVKECTNDFPNNLASQNYCQSVVCGSKNASTIAQNKPSGSGSSGATTTSGGSGGSSTASSSASPAASKGAAVMVRGGTGWSTGALVVGLFGVFGMGL